MSTDAPAFAPIEHPKPPSSYWGTNNGPYQTNAWFENFVLDGADQLVQAYPFSVKARDDGLSISIPNLVRKLTVVCSSVAKIKMLSFNI